MTVHGRKGRCRRGPGKRKCPWLKNVAESEQDLYRQPIENSNE